MATEIKYNGATIATVNGGETATMNTANKKMAGDVEVVVEEVTQSAEAIIDVDELPQALEVYMLTNGIKNEFNGVKVKTKCIIVDTLPEVGENFFINLQQNLTAVFYYQKSDSNVYTYYVIDNSAIWEKIDIIYSEEEAVDANITYYLLKENEINTQAFYRVSKATNGAGYIYMPGMGAITLPQFAQSMGIPVFEEIVVGELPATGKPTDTVNMSAVYAYTNLANGIVYYYYSIGTNSGWYPLTVALSSIQGVNVPDNGFVDSVDEMTEMGVYVLRTETKPILYHYKNGWNEVGSGGAESGGSIKTRTITTFAEAYNYFINPSKFLRGEIVYDDYSYNIVNIRQINEGDITFPKLYTAPHFLHMIASEDGEVLIQKAIELSFINLGGIKAGVIDTYTISTNYADNLSTPTATLGVALDESKMSIIVYELP